jgi:hypothetical protein
VDDWLQKHHTLLLGAGSLAMWIMAAGVVYVAVLETVRLVGHRMLRNDLDDLTEWIEGQVSSIHRRLDNGGVPGVYVPPTKDDPPRDPVTVVVRERTDTAVLPTVDAQVRPRPTDRDPADATHRATAALRSALLLPQPDLDRPRPWQHAEPTRPDFRAQRAPEVPMAPTFVAPGDGPPEVVEPRTSGRHRSPGDGHR